MQVIRQDHDRVDGEGSALLLACEDLAQCPDISRQKSALPIQRRP